MRWSQNCRRRSLFRGLSGCSRSTAFASSTRTGSASHAPRIPRRSSCYASRQTRTQRWSGSRRTSEPRCSRSSPMRRFLTSVLFLASSSAMAACPPLLDRTMDTIHDQPQSMCEYQGKVLLVVNTASQCGYTPQYEGLEALHRKYGRRGLVVLGFPSNDFGGQEPGSNKEIASFCVNQYAVDFPVFGKTVLKKNPLYADLAKASGKAPQWNFHKYLVDRSGKQVLSFDTRVEPEDVKLVAAIERLLQAQ